MQEKGRVGAPYNRKYDMNLAPSRPVIARYIQRLRALGTRKAFFQKCIPLKKVKEDIVKFK